MFWAEEKIYHFKMVLEKIKNLFNFVDKMAIFIVVHHYLSFASFA
jgi:hypothetical protein